MFFCHASVQLAFELLLLLQLNKNTCHCLEHCFSVDLSSFIRTQSAAIELWNDVCPLSRRDFGLNASPIFLRLMCPRGVVVQCRWRRHPSVHSSPKLIASLTNWLDPTTGCWRSERGFAPWVVCPCTFLTMGFQLSSRSGLMCWPYTESSRRRACELVVIFKCNIYNSAMSSTVLTTAWLQLEWETLVLLNLVSCCRWILATGLAQTTFSSRAYAETRALQSSASSPMHCVVWYLTTVLVYRECVDWWWISSALTSAC